MYFEFTLCVDNYSKHTDLRQTILWNKAVKMIMLATTSIKM